MAKKSKKTEAPEEEAVRIKAAAKSAEDSAEENIAVSEGTGIIEPAEEVKADEANGAEAEEIGSETKTGTVSRPVNFRTGPSFGRAVIAELKAGAKVILTGTEAGDKGKWYKCEFDGRTGYVKASGVIVDK